MFVFRHQRPHYSINHTMRASFVQTNNLIASARGFRCLNVPTCSGGRNSGTKSKLILLLSRDSNLYTIHGQPWSDADKHYSASCEQLSPKEGLSDPERIKGRLIFTDAVCNKNTAI